MTKTKPIPTLTAEEAARFWSKVDRRGPDDCWEWQGAQRPSGYGSLWVQKHYFSAHRVAYTLGHCHAPGGLYVCHTCDNPSCCNPQHLFLGTHAENSRDMVRKGRSTKDRPRPGASRPGVLNPQAKLTEDQVRTIRAATGTHETIAAQFGVSRRCIGFIRCHEHWKHVA